MHAQTGQACVCVCTQEMTQTDKDVCIIKLCLCVRTCEYMQQHAATHIAQPLSIQDIYTEEAQG